MGPTDIFDHFEVVVVFTFGCKVVAGFVESGKGRVSRGLGMGEGQRRRKTSDSDEDEDKREQRADQSPREISQAIAARAFALLFSRAGARTL
jgi:hypothetical protein